MRTVAVVLLFIGLALMNGVSASGGPPVITIYSPENTTYADTNITLNVSTNEVANVTYSLNGTANTTLYLDMNAGDTNITLPDGRYNITVYANDSTDLNSGIVYFTVDTTLPVASNPVPANNSYSSDTGQNISITLLDALSDVNAGSIVMSVVDTDYNAGSPELVYDANTGALNFTADPSNFTNGQVVNITVDANDNAGNTMLQIGWSFTVDTTPPVASNPVPGNNSYTSDTGQNISITLLDALSDVNAGGIVMNVEGDDYDTNSGQLIYDVNSGALNLSLSSGNFTDGQVVNITVDANDNAGNTMLQIGWSFTVDLMPVITIYSPENTTYNTSSITLNVSTNEAANVTYSLNGTANVSLFNDTNSGDTNITVLDGRYNITFYAADEVWDANSGIVYFTVDTTPPVASNPVPANNSYTNYTGQNISITLLDALSDVNAGSIVMSIVDTDYDTNSGQLSYDVNTGALNFTVSAGNFTDGQVVNITVDADDNAGNTMLQIGWSFTVETGAPAITFESPTPSNGESLSSSTTTVTIKVNTIEASPDTIILNWGGTNVSVESYDAGNAYWNKIKTVSSGNSYSFYAWANDTNGSANRTETRTFSVQSSSSSSGNGGGNGGGDDTDTPETVTVTATVETGKATATISSASNGDTAKVTIPTATDVFFTEMSIKLKADISNAQITVSTLSSKPATITETISGVIHSYIQVDTSNIAVTNVDTVTIKFKVPFSWINDNNIDKTKVVLNRYSGGKWNSLTTTRTSETSSHIFYSATSPGLSTFGVSGQVKGASATTAPPATTSAPTTTPPPTTQPPATTPSPTSAPASVLFKAPDYPASGLSWSDKLAIAMAIVLVIIAAMELRSRSERWRYR